jgi:pimeloyl-ACP methyl ester carboxylesterase
MRTIDIPAGESVIVSVATGTVSAPPNGLAAVFGLEFRVGGFVSCYVGRSVNVTPSNAEHTFNAQSGGLPNTGEVLRDTAQNTTYYMRLTNSSGASSRVSVQTDLKEIKVYPRGPAVSTSTDNYFIIHGRESNYDDRRIQNLLTSLAVRVNDPNSRYFRVDWSAAAASNYPSLLLIPGLQGSRFIVPAGRALKKLVVDPLPAGGQGVPASRISVWGHSWGSYVSSEFAKASGSYFKALVALDPAELNLGGWIGNAYFQPRLRERATHSFALVARHGLYGGEGEADTADLSIRITARKPNGDILADNDPLHWAPVRCMVYALNNYHSDAVSEALVRGALWQPGPRERTIVDQDPDHPDATMDGYTDDSGNNYSGHGLLINGSVTISP